jgi:hypothetical protein
MKWKLKLKISRPNSKNQKNSKKPKPGSVRFEWVSLTDGSSDRRRVKCVLCLRYCRDAIVEYRVLMIVVAVHGWIWKDIVMSIVVVWWIVVVCRWIVVVVIVVIIIIRTRCVVIWIAIVWRIVIVVVVRRRRNYHRIVQVNLGLVLDATPLWRPQLKFIRKLKIFKFSAGNCHYLLWHSRWDRFGLRCIEFVVS